MAKRVIPFGNRILVKRRNVGDATKGEGSIILPDAVKGRETELAVVLEIPDPTEADKAILEKADELIEKMKNEGDYEGLERIRDYLLKKSVNVGDMIFIGKYAGIDFHDNETRESRTMVLSDDIVGLVVENE